MARCGTTVVSMNCMRALTLVVSSYFLFSVQAFAINGNFRTLIEAARNAQTTAEVSRNSNYSQPAIWEDDCNKQQLFHEAKIIGKDDRRGLTADEEKQTTGTGYFFESNDSNKNLFGNGVVVEDRSFIMTSAHLFVKDNDWLPEMKTNGKVDFSKAKYFSPVCGKEYEIEDLKVLTMDPEKYPHKDISLIKFKTPLCHAAKPNKIEALDDKDLESLKAAGAVYIAAYRGSVATNTKPNIAGRTESGRPSVGAQKTFKTIGYGKYVDEFYAHGSYKAITYTVDTEGGTSGAGLVANFDQPVVIGINHGPSNQKNLNVATLITPTIENWVKSSISQGKIQ